MTTTEKKFSEFGASPACYMLTDIFEKTPSTNIHRKIRRIFHEIDVFLKEIIFSSMSKQMKIRVINLYKANRLQYLDSFLNKKGKNVVDNITYNIFYMKFREAFKRIKN